MADLRFRPARIYKDGQLLVHVNASTYTHTSGDEQQFGTEGAMGFSDGADTTRLEITNIVSVGGQERFLREVIKNKSTVSLVWQGDGGAESMNGRLIERSYESASQQGTLTSRLTFIGGPPEIII